MKTVGLTGNMGSGKSFISSIFALLGVPVYHADQESKGLLQDDTVKEMLRKVFGTAVFTGDGEVDRKNLAGIVFSDASSLKTLNSILHPLVKENFREWVSLQHEARYVIHEAAIILESGFQGEFDRIIHVACPKEIAIARVMERDYIGREEILKRMQFQMEDKKKAALSDFVIRNDGSEMVIPQVLAVHQALLKICT
jgi:dephospho-CoA kinase